jgi:hypothetical protein
MTNEISELLTNIGYNIANIITPYQYNPNSIQGTVNETYLLQVLNVYDYATGRTDKITWIFFYIQNTTTINYNNFKSTVYFNHTLYNTFIYPYVTEGSALTITPNIYVKYINTSNNTNNVYFDNTDLCAYVDKLDYKYFENKTYTKAEKKLNLSINYSKNIKLFSEYVKENTNFSDNSETILINLNDYKYITARIEYEKDNINDIYTLEERLKKEYSNIKSMILYEKIKIEDILIENNNEKICKESVNLFLKYSSFLLLSSLEVFFIKITIKNYNYNNKKKLKIKYYKK